MHPINLKMLITILFLFVASLPATGQFSYKPKKANLTISFDQTSGWVLSNQAGNKSYIQFTEENAYIQIINNQLKVYTMSASLWNSHPDTKFMDATNIPSTTIEILANSNVFSSFSSFWISSAGGHIRVFKYPETISIPDDNGLEETAHNQNIGNHIFLNQKKHSQISSVNTIFMISPSGNVFELDKGKFIWRFILKNRTLTPWSSNPPSDKMLFNIFSKEDFKKIIFVGEKEDCYLFQIVNHDNKMGLASLSKDYFQISIDVPPLFDFISPSTDEKYHLIYTNKELGVLFFVPQENESEKPEFIPFYTNAKKQLYSKTDYQEKGLLLADHKPFSVLKNGETYNSANFKSLLNFGLEVINEDLLLYNEYSEEQKITNSGLYRISQNQWYIKPKNGFLKHFPNAIIQVQNTTTEKDNSYTVYNSNGFLQFENITSLISPEFKFLASQVSGIQIDSLLPVSNFTPNSFLFKSNEKWGVINIKNENITVQLPANYQSIQSFGEKQSLLLFNEGKFGWFGYPLNDTSITPKLIEPHTPYFNLYEGNTLTSQNPLTANHYSAQIIGELHVFNSHESQNSKSKNLAWISLELETNHEMDAKKITPINSFINVEDAASDKMQLYSSNLKPIKTLPYDSIMYSEDWVFLISKKPTSNINNVDTSYPRIVDGFFGNKKLGFFKKFTSVYFYDNHFIANKDQQWSVFNPDGKLTTKEAYQNFESAQKFIQNL